MLMVDIIWMGERCGNDSSISVNFLLIIAMGVSADKMRPNIFGFRILGFQFRRNWRAHFAVTGARCPIGGT